MPKPKRPELTDADWQASLKLIQRAAAAARSMQEHAYLIAREAHDSVQHSTEAARVAAERVRQADAALNVADARADQAEAILAALRVKLLATEKRMHEAELQAGIVQDRFKVLCTRIEDEFECLTVATPTRYGATYDRSTTDLPVHSPVRTTRPVIPIVSDRTNRQAGIRIRRAAP